MSNGGLLNLWILGHILVFDMVLAQHGPDRSTGQQG
jgi:hypothetical protein